MDMVSSAEWAGTSLLSPAVWVRMEETKEEIRLLCGPDKISDSSASREGGPRKVSTAL